jgi:hypothetical protein
LFLLAPTIGELLSGSSPPGEFFKPVPLLLMAFLYGGGALLARELLRAWRKGWPTLLTLGIAYAIIEEGLCCKSFFDPNWPNVGIPGCYGRWLGVNWVRTTHLALYHTVFNILIPITLVEFLFPATRDVTWLGPRMSWTLTGLLAFVMVLGCFALPDLKNPLRPPPVGYGLALAEVAALLCLGVNSRPSTLRSPDRRSPFHLTKAMKPKPRWTCPSRRRTPCARGFLG